HVQRPPLNLSFQFRMEGTALRALGRQKTPWRCGRDPYLEGADAGEAMASLPDFKLSQPPRPEFGQRWHQTLLYQQFSEHPLIGPGLHGQTGSRDYLPGGLYTPRSSLAFFRTCVISSGVHRRVSFALCIVPVDSTTPEIAGATLGSGTSKITNTPGPSVAVLYIEINLPPAASIRFLAAS